MRHRFAFSGVTSSEPLHITTGAECSTFTGHHQHPDVITLSNLRKRRVESVVNFIAESVSRFGSVKRQHGDRAVHSAEKFVGSGVEFGHGILRSDVFLHSRICDGV